MSTESNFQNRVFQMISNWKYIHMLNPICPNWNLSEHAKKPRSAFVTVTLIKTIGVVTSSWLWSSSSTCVNNFSRGCIQYVDITREDDLLFVVSLKKRVDPFSVLSRWQGECITNGIHSRDRYDTAQHPFCWHVTEISTIDFTHHSVHPSCIQSLDHAGRKDTLFSTWRWSRWQGQRTDGSRRVHQASQMG
jgi:hypothetical protein